jgi:cytochrome-b5 reductase
MCSNQHSRHRLRVGLVGPAHAWLCVHADQPFCSVTTTTNNNNNNNNNNNHPPTHQTSISMIAGGSGITPMFQALDLLVNTPGDTTEVTLVYGNATPADVLLKDELASLVAASEGRLTVVHVVGTSADQAPIEGWDGALGWVDKAKIDQFCHKPAADMLMFVCGLPGLYAAMCGPRSETNVAEGTVLHQLGYTDNMVVKF